MEKNIPYRPKKIIKRENNDIGDLIRSYRLLNNITQKKLAQDIGCSYSAINNYECGRRLPFMDNIYKLSERLAIDRESLFNMVLKEYFYKLQNDHHEIYLKYVLNGDISSRPISCFPQIGKVKYNFKRLSYILKKYFIVSKESYTELSNNLRKDKRIKKKYEKSYLVRTINGKGHFPINIIIDLAIYYNLDSFNLYKIYIEEKGLALAKNMMEQWEIYKKEMDKNETKN